VCGDEMEYKETDLIGMSISFKINDDSIKKHPEYLKILNNFGKTEFNVCYSCWLKSMGIKRKASSEISKWKRWKGKK